MMGKLYEDFEIGESFITPARSIGEYEIAAFAGLSGDYNPVHTDHEFASGTAFGKPIAHGLLGISISTGLISRSGAFDGTTIALLAIDEWRFIGPILVGDTVHVEFEVSAKRETSNPSVGIITRTMRIVNQRGEEVQTGKMTLMMRRRTQTG